MSEESRTITLPLGDTSDGPRLGVYYIDMRPARVHYAPVNIWGGGFDADGVPMLREGSRRIYLAVNIAQYGFMLHADWLESRDASTLGTLKACGRVLDDLATETNDGLAWWHQEPDRRYGIRPPWASAMAQGEAISFYLRLFQATDDNHYLDQARRSARFLNVDVSRGGVRRTDAAGDLWFEEYPSEPPSYVLNGFVYTMFGLWDLWRVEGRREIRDDFDRCVGTLERNLHRYDTGYWSLYDQFHSELVRYYYQKNVHVPQMDVLHRLTGRADYGHYRERWQTQLTPANFLRVRVMYRVRPRLQKFRRWLADSHA